MAAGPKEGAGVLAMPQQLFIGLGWGGSLHPRSHFYERGQVRASLQRQQKAFNPLISGI